MGRIPVRPVRLSFAVASFAGKLLHWREWTVNSLSGWAGLHRKQPTHVIGRKSGGQSTVVLGQSAELLGSRCKRLRRSAWSFLVFQDLTFGQP
jgi:hypothetical protein